jgi:uncharacterized membrane protein YccC
VAGLDSLPHGFWAMLAALSLTRTTAVQTRGAVRSALIGTGVGAVAAGSVLALAGGTTTVYSVAMPVVMLVAFAVGPVRGVGWSQAMFTLVIALVFAQLSPVDWRLAEVRFLDVLIGSVIGIVCGLFAWPRGAQDELGRSVALLLHAASDQVAATTNAVWPGGVRDGAAAPDDRRVEYFLRIAESAFAQYAGEAQRPAGPGPDWQAALMAGHHVLWGSRRVREAAAQAGDGAPRDGARAYGLWVADRFRAAADRLEARDGGDGRLAAPPRTPDPDGASTAHYTAVAWLDSLTVDLNRMAAGRAANGP